LVFIALAYIIHPYTTPVNTPQLSESGHAAVVRALRITPDADVSQKHNLKPRVCRANSFWKLMSEDACVPEALCFLTTDVSSVIRARAFLLLLSLQK